MTSTTGKPKKKTGGLAGVVAGKTAIATVGKEGKGLNYRGYSIYDLAENAKFEEALSSVCHDTRACTYACAPLPYVHASTCMCQDTDFVLG